MSTNPPYSLRPGSLSKVFEKIKEAATPERFTQDFLASKLGLRGGSYNAVIPVLKRIGFLTTEGSPTELYRQFRNPEQAGAAAAAALRKGYGALFEMNESAHRLDDKGMRGLIAQATGLKSDSRVLQAIMGTFKAIKQHATWESDKPIEERREAEVANLPANLPSPPRAEGQSLGMNLSYTINLNLPATPDIKVFDAIFRSLREHLLKR